MTSQTATLYEALGAESGIRTAVDDFYRRVTADPELTRYFAGADMRSLRRHQANMLITATGGPSVYDGRDMADAHRSSKITQDAFDKVVGHLGATLSDAGVSDETIASVVAVLAPLAPSIVTA